MRTKKMCRLLLLVAIAGALACLTACEVFFPLSTLGGVCQFFDKAQIRQPTAEGDSLVFEVPGTIAVFQGFACAESDRNGEEDIIRLAKSLPLPDYARSATVFLSGWKVKYLHKDHHISGLGTFIRNIAIEDRSAKWEAIGVLGDHNFDDGYEWCYHYTVLAWNPSNVALVIDDEDVSCDPDDAVDPEAANFFTAENNLSGSLSAFPSFLKNPGFAAGRSVAILPRGFGFIQSGDHHLLQLGEHLDNSEMYIQGGASYNKVLSTLIPLPEPAPPAPIASQADSEFVSWETFAAFKDNSTRDYRFGEVFSGLGGGDVGLIQPPFALQPRDDDDGSSPPLLGPHQGLHTQEFVVENVPFALAIPVLSGWELAYDGDDEHVTEAGVWIENMHYDRDPAASVGTLHYTLSSILRDKNSHPGHLTQHKVTILGIRPLGPGVVAHEKKADLIPFSPLGNDPVAFCRLEEQRKLLRVTVKNQGSADAGPSQTTVTFAAGSFSMNTPAILEGGSVDLLFKVPEGCFSPDCTFRIRVDSAGQVDEGGAEGNNSVGGGCSG